jgi:hypothetical protein
MEALRVIREYPETILCLCGHGFGDLVYQYLPPGHGFTSHGKNIFQSDGTLA